MKTKNTALRRLVAGAGALTIAMAGVVASGTAFADTNVGPDQPGNPGKGSLTIHKVEGEQADTPSDGTVQDMTERTLLNGVEFTIWQLGLEEAGECVAINLADTDAWTDGLVDKITGPDGAPATLGEVEADGFCLADPVVGATSGNGAVTFPNLDLGLYYVQETDVADATNASTDEPVTVVSHAAPFYVTIPLPNDGDWVYDVHAYPKNQTLDAPVKTINVDADQDGLHIGDTVEFTITQTVPALDSADATYDSASIWDNMGTSFEYDETATLTLNGAVLDEDTDYEILESDALVRWNLTGALADLNAGDVLEVVFTATVLEVTETGEIANPGSEDPTKPGYGSEFNGTPGPEGPTPYTYWGELSIFKHDQADAPLANATFQVFEANESGQCAVEVPEGAPVATGTSDSTGIVQWEGKDPSDPLGLWVANTQSEDPNVSKVYCVYETVIPAGYSAVDTMYEVEIAPGLTTETFDVVNTQKEGPDLPLTGAAGTVALMTGGVLLLGAGVAVMVMARRRRIMEV